jgi:hypothetical protein
MVALSAPAALAQTPVPGENVNMVSGTQWPGGDPFLQRQNEPSLAVSSVNAQHLLAGANDYRTVDLPFPFDPADPTIAETGDAWHGLFKSLDGGQSWQSLLLPGYPQDVSTAPMQGANSPLRTCTTDPVPDTRCTAGADPMVRAGTHGLLYYSGIAFRRGTNYGKVFVARFQDLNNQEGGDVTQGNDPIKYLDTSVVANGSATTFLDKPALAVDLPRAGALTCTLPAVGNQPARQVPGGIVYVAYSQFYGPPNAQATSDLFFTRSLDCGATWAQPVKLNGPESLLNQGASIAVDPRTGFVYVAWRRFASLLQGDAIFVARSFSQGQRFTKPKLLASVNPFDQDPSPTIFRSEAFPSIAISVAPDGGDSWAHVAWSQRPSASGDGQVVLATSEVNVPSAPNENFAGCGDWSAPAPVDATPLADDFGNTFSRGHQFMPQLTFSQGRLMVLYYDSRTDHTRTYYQPHVPFAPDARGRYYQEQKAPLVRLGPAPLPAPLAVDPAASVFQPLIDEASVHQTRHTLDVRVGASPPGAHPRFTTAQVSQYPFGTRGDEGAPETVPSFGAAPITVVDASGNLQLLEQLQHNPPNLPLFKSGTVPFLGDYIDIQGPAFVLRPGGRWAFNTAPSSTPVFHAVWTTNQDVRPPRDGDWTHYTPVRLPVGAGSPASVFDPNQQRPACVPGQEGMRNQNIYASRITEGFLVTSPQNVKPLSPTVTRGFVVLLQNNTAGDLALQLSLAPLPAGLSASFKNNLGAGTALQRLQLVVRAHTSASRTLFVQAASPAASVTVNANEVVGGTCLAGATCALKPGGASGFVTLNPPGSNPSLVAADGTPVATEVYASLVLAPNVSNPNVSNPNVSNPNVSNPNVSNPNVSNPNVSNPNVSNPDLVNSVPTPNVSNPNVSNPNVSNPNVSNPNVSNPNVSNPNVSNPNVSNAAVSDLTYTVTNTGNTTTSYSLTLVTGTTAPLPPLQLIASKRTTTPIGIGCRLYEQPHYQVVANVPNVTPAIVTPSSLVDPGVQNGAATAASVVLAPGETAVITLRGMLPLSAPAGAPPGASMLGIAAQVAPVAVPQSVLASPQVTYAAPPPNVVYPVATVAASGNSTTAPTFMALAYGAANDSWTATLTAGTASSAAPTGTVTFTRNGSTVLRTVPLDTSVGCTSTGCALTLPNSLQAGDTLGVYYAGDAAHGASSSGDVALTRSAYWAARAPMPTPRDWYAAVELNGLIYAIGGELDFLTGTPTAAVEAYDPVTDTWTSKAPLGVPRSALGSAVLNGKIYVMGGIASAVAPYTVEGSVEMYDPALDLWTTLPPLPTARYGVEGFAAGGKVYAVGGATCSGSVCIGSGASEVYDPVANAWAALAPIPNNIETLAGTAAGLGGAIYSFDYSTGVESNAIDRYDPVTDTWTLATAGAAVPVNLGGYAMAGGKFYILGGDTNAAPQFPLTAAVQVYDPVTGTWSASGPPIPTPRYAPAAVTANGKIYVLGGYLYADWRVPGAETGAVEVYTP